MREPVKKYYLVVEYLGTRFHGWQRQPGLRTVQGEVERALSIFLHGERVSALASGRTDTGVHARAQAFTITVPESVNIGALCHSLSSMLKNELSVRGVCEVPSHFHVLNDAVRKQYSYVIYTGRMPPVLDSGRVWHLSVPLDVQAMEKAAREFLGKHNFLSFCAGGSFSKTFERQIFESEITVNGPLLIYRVIGSGFLKQMVRNMVGTLVDVGRGRLEKSLPEILAGRDRRLAGVTAQPFGLHMDWVEHRVGEQLIRSDTLGFSLA